MLTQQQVTQLTKALKATGRYTDLEISQAIARKNQQQVKIDLVAQQPVQSNQPMSTNIPPVTQSEPRTLGGLAKNAGQDVLDFVINAPVQAIKSVAGVGFETSRNISTALDEKNIKKRTRELEKINTIMKSEKDQEKLRKLETKKKFLLKQLQERTDKTLKTAGQTNPFIDINELPSSQKGVGGELLRNIGRTFGYNEETGGFDIETAIQSAYEKPITTLLVAKDVYSGIRRAGTKSATEAVSKDVTKAAGKDNVLTRTGSELREGVLNPKTKSDPFAPQRRAEMLDLQKKLELKGSAKEQAKLVNKKFISEQTRIKKLLKDSPPIEKGTTSDLFLKEIDNANYGLDDAQFAKAVETEMEILSKLEGGSAVEAYELMNKYRELLKSARKKQANGTTLLPKEEARLAAFNALKDSIDTVSTEVKVANNLQHDLYEISYGLEKSINKKGVGVGPVRLPSRASQSVQDATGRTLESVGNMSPLGGMSRLPNSPTGAGGAALLSGAVNPRQTTDQPQIVPAPTNTLDATTGTDTSLTDTSLTAKAHPVFGNLTKQEVLLKGFQSGLNQKQLDEVETVYDRFDTTGEDEKLELSDGAIKTVYEIKGAITDITGLRKKIEDTKIVGPISGLRAVNPYDVDANALQAEIDRVRQVVGKALEGGVLRKEDEEKYKKILPKLTDTKELALSKLEALEIKLNSDIDNYVSLQREYGKGKGIENILQQ